MKKLIAVLLAAAMLLSCAAAEDYTDVAKRYLNTYGRWWDYSPELWLEYAVATRAADTGSSHSARAIAATEYILPPEGALSYEQAAAIAIQAAGGQAYKNIPCFLLEGRAVYKVLLHEDEPFSGTVELDAVTGEILGIYPAITVEAAYYFVPNAVWVAVSLQYSPETLARMTWSQLFDAYIARYGDWQNWNSVLWGEFAGAVRLADVSNSRTGRAVAATEYVRPSHEALLEAEAVDIALAAVAGEAKAIGPVLCCKLNGQTLYKIILRTAEMTCSVELDAFTGEIHGIYPRTTEGVGQFFVPHAVWEATPSTAPNG